MFTLAPFVAAVLTLVAMIASVTDIRSRRIPNWLTAFGILAGFSLNIFLYGLPGLKNASLGVGIALLVYFPLFCVKGMGAGDVKLMVAIGALVGPGNWLRIFIFTALIGGAIALVLILYRGFLNRTLHNVGHILMSPFRGRLPYQDNPQLDVTSGAGLSLPHGAVIALGTFLFVFVSLI